jgi:hypothetical protein
VAVFVIDNAAAIETYGAVAVPACELKVMGCHDERLAQLMKRLEGFEAIRGPLRIESREWLIKQDDRGRAQLGHQETEELPLAARQGLDRLSRIDVKVKLRKGAAGNRRP